MSPIVEQFAPLRVAGLAIRTNNQKLEVMAGVWQRVLAENALAPLAQRTDPHSLFAVYTEYESDHTGDYTFVLGVPIPTSAVVPEGFQAIELIGGNYARYDAQGAMPQVVGQTWQEIWAEPLKRAYRTDYERYDVRRMAGEDAQLSVFVGVSE